MDYNNNRLPGHSGPGGLLLSCRKKKQKIKKRIQDSKKALHTQGLKSRNPAGSFTRLEADNGNRTRLPSLGSWCSTDELHLHNTDIISCILENSSVFSYFCKNP